MADLNGDGFADLPTANAGSDGVAVLLNDGTATATSVRFSPARQYPTGPTPYGVATGDINGDHIADLVAANEGGNTVSVLLGNGDGTLVTQPPIALSSGTGYGPRNAIIADLNGDGKNDVATENQDDDSVSLLLNTTSPWPGTSSGSVSFYKDPATQFPPDYETGSVPYGLSAADFNRDGKDDLVTANAYCRDGSGSATPQANCGSESNSISVLLNNRTGDPTSLFAPAANYATAPNPRSLAIGDFNEDRSSDIATANFNVNSVSILLNDGQGRFPGHAEIASSTWPRSDAVGDFNGATGTGDGHTDLAVANQDSNNLNVYLGDGSGRFGDGSGATSVPTGTYATGNGPFWVSSGDVNHDDRQDAVTANYPRQHGLRAPEQHGAATTPSAGLCPQPVADDRLGRAQRRWRLQRPDHLDVASRPGAPDRRRPAAEHPDDVHPQRHHGRQLHADGELHPDGVDRQRDQAGLPSVHGDRHQRNPDAYRHGPAQRDAEVRR